MSDLEPIIGEARYDTDTTGLRDLVSALKALEKESGVVADLLDRTSTAGRKAGDGLEQTGRAAKGSQQHIVNVNDALRETQKILGSLTTAYQLALHEASAFGHEMGQVATLNREVAGDTEAFRQRVLQLSTTLGVDAVQAANGFYQVLSAGSASTAEGGLKIVSVAMKAAVAGATDTATAVDGMTTAINAWQLGADQAGRVSDVMFKAVAEGKMTFGEMSHAMFEAAPLASSLGISLEEVSAAVTTITKKGAPASVAFTQVRSAMTGLITPGDDLQKVFDVIAKRNEQVAAATGPAIIKALGFHGALQQVVAVAGELGVALPTAFGRIEGVNAALALSGKNAEGAARDLDLMRNSAGETDRAYAIMADTFQFQSEKLRVNTQAVLIELGTTLGQMLVPAMRQVQEMLQGLLGWWEHTDEGTRRFIITVTGLVGLLGTGAGAFLSMRIALQAIGPMFVSAAGGATALQVAMGGLGGVILVLGLVVKAVTDLNSALDTAYQKQQDNSNLARQNTGLAVESLNGYLAVTKRVREESSKSLLGNVGLLVSAQGLRQEVVELRQGTEAWLAWGLGVDKAVLASGGFQQKSLELAIAQNQGKLTLQQYRDQVLAAADAASVAADKGHVLSEAQRQQAEQWANTTRAMLRHVAGLDQTTIDSERMAGAIQRASEAVALGGAESDKSRGQLAALGKAMQFVAEQTDRVERSQAQGTGTLKSYTSQFEGLFKAGSLWKSDPAEQTKQVEKAWSDLSASVGKNLQEQLDGWDKYQKDLADAKAADAAAAASANEAAHKKQADAEAKHQDNLEKIQRRSGRARTDVQRQNIAWALQDENERFSKIASITEVKGGENVRRVQQQYKEQIAAQREALAQMTVDHFKSMVLMGETSEQTAKTVFATLRKAYPDVEVLSPVADAAVHYLALVRDAANDASATQQQSISELPKAAEAALGIMHDTEAEYGRTIDSWKTADERLAESHDAVVSRMMTADGDLVAQTDRTGSLIMGKHASVADSGDELATRMEGSLGRWRQASATTAGEVGVHGQAIRDTSQHTADKLAQDAQSIEGSTGLVSGGYRSAADEIKGASDRILGSTATIKDQSLNLSSTSAETVAALSHVWVEHQAALDGLSTALKPTQKAVADFKQTGIDTGRQQQRSFQDVSDSATNLQRTVSTSMDTSKRSMGEAQRAAEDLTKSIDDVPREIQIRVTMTGLEMVLSGLDQIGSEARATAHALSNTIDFQNRYQQGGGSGAGSTPPAGGGHPPIPHESAPPANLGDSLSSVTDALGGLAEGYTVTIYGEYVPTSPATEIDGGQLALQRMMWELHDHAKPIVVEFDDTQFQQKISDAQRALDATQASASELGARLAATFNQFLRGGEGEPGSLAWLTNKWSGSDFKPFDTAGLQQFFASLNVPVKTMAEFQRYWDGLSPEKQSNLWKRMYDDLRLMEKDRHDKRVAYLQKEMDEAKAHGKELYAEELQQQLDDEAQRHDRINGLLEERDRLIKRQFDDWRDGYRDVTEAERALEAAQRDRERAEEDFRRKQVDRLHEAQREEEDFERRAHDRVMQLLDIEEERVKKKYDAELRALDGLVRAENKQHDKRLADLDAESDAIRRYIDDQERSLRKMHTDLDNWVENESGLAALKGQLDDVNKALQQLSSRSAGRAGRERPKPEDLARTQLTPEQRKAIQAGLDAGLYTPEQERRARVALAQGQVRVGYARELLTIAQEYFKTEVDGVENEIDRRKKEIDLAERLWAIEKDGLDTRLKGIEDSKKAEDRRHTARLGDIAAERTAVEQMRTDDLAFIDELRKAENARHDARMTQMEEEYAFALMVAEGLTPEQAAAKIGQMRANVAQALYAATKFFAELLKNTPRIGPAPPPGGSAPITPPPGGGGGGIGPGPRNPTGTPAQDVVDIIGIGTGIGKEIGQEIVDIIRIGIGTGIGKEPPGGALIGGARSGPVTGHQVPYPGGGMRLTGGIGPLDSGPPTPDSVMGILVRPPDEGSLIHLLGGPRHIRPEPGTGTLGGPRHIGPNPWADDSGPPTPDSVLGMLMATPGPDSMISVLGVGVDGPIKTIGFLAGRPPSDSLLSVLAGASGGVIPGASPLPVVGHQRPDPGGGMRLMGGPRHISPNPWADDSGPPTPDSMRPLDSGPPTPDFMRTIGAFDAGLDAASLSLRDFTRLLQESNDVMDGRRDRHFGHREGDSNRYQFYAPIYVEDQTPTSRHLRERLSGGWGTTGSP